MNKFHTIRIKDIKRETPDCVSIVLDVPENLSETFAFISGQHLVFRAMQGDQEIRRSYSICSCPEDGELRIGVKRLEGGYFSNYLNEQAKVGDTLEVMRPQGNFYTQLDSKQSKRYLAVAAGSGITPILSIVKSILRTEPESEVILLYGNRNKGSILFKEEIEALKNRHLERFSVYHILSREKAEAEFLNGRITREKLDYFLENLLDAQLLDEVFLCGPEEMIFAGKDALVAAGVPNEHIHFELFYSADAEAKRAQRELRQIGDGFSSPVSKVTMKLDASTLEFELAYEGESLLDAALRNGADLPYSCKGGVCATCKCKLEQGEVEMDVNYSLEPEELEQGFILACQAHPNSEELLINFDIK